MVRSVMTNMRPPRMIPSWRLWAVPAAYGVQLLIVLWMWAVPLVDVQDERHRYVVSRFSGGQHFLPVIGILNLLIGEPVRFELTDKQTGNVTVSYPDLVTDVAHDYPAVARALER